MPPSLITPFQEDYMPYINLQITKGASRNQKEQIVKEFTETLEKVLGKNRNTLIL